MNFEEQIVSKIGKNSTGGGKVAKDDLTFKEVTLSNGTKTFSFYTYKGKVCVLDNMGWDVDFDSYSEADQKLIFDSIMKNLK